MSNEAKAYQDPGTPEEVSRRAFLARATIFGGTVVGLGLAIPLIGSLVPKAELVDANRGFSPLNKDEFAQLEQSVDKPVKIFFDKTVVNGFLSENTDYYVWGIKLTDAELAEMRKERPGLFSPKPGSGIDYPVGTMNFVMFSSLCPHLNCKYDWDSGLNAFLCPCHGSQFNKLGIHMRDARGSFIGPAPRGLDPLPFNQEGGVAQVEWIKFAANTPDIVRMSYW